MVILYEYEEENSMILSIRDKRIDFCCDAMVDSALNNDSYKIKWGMGSNLPGARDPILIIAGETARFCPHCGKETSVIRSKQW